MFLIAPFERKHASAVASLNLAWLTAHDLLEPADQEDLADPEGRIIGNGGDIFVAILGGTVVGCCALLVHEEDVYELARLAVAPALQGKGIGRRLVERCLERARQRGGRRVTLVSNSRLSAAIKLYESVGFRHGAVPQSVKYRTADIYMELDLRGAAVSLRS